jgi:hypothetical protein
LVIDTKKLEHAGVKSYRVADVVTNPALPEDDEYILVAADFGTVAESVVVRRYEVLAP